MEEEIRQILKKAVTTKERLSDLAERLVSPVYGSWGPMSNLDGYIAAIVRSRNCAVATRNVIDLVECGI